MRFPACALLSALLITAFVACGRRGEADTHETGTKSKDTRQADPREANDRQIDKPDETDDEPPLLLEEPDNPKDDLPPPVGPVADNERCYVCHRNYEDDRLAALHAQGNVGCEVCHGDSSAHCSDENNITAPDTIYAAAQVNPACLTCHPERSDDHDPDSAGASRQKGCTDCHEFNEHRLPYRTRKWDKNTGRLITSDGVRM